MKQGLYKVIENTRLCGDIMRMRLEGDTSAITAPGQFINIKLEGFFLRRPISICDWDENSITIIYKVVGHGTELMEGMTDETLDVLTGLGNGFDSSCSGDRPLLIGGGVGTPPMYALAKELIAQGKKPHILLGFNSKKDIFYEDEFRALGLDVTVTTVDGSYGINGYISDGMKDIEYSYFYACGPEPMLKAVYKAGESSGQLSFEERMGCGFGACMGCSCKTLTGYKRICKDGPVMEKEEILWAD